MKRIITVLIFLCGFASAQTATELFNPAAREYIFGNTPVASNLVTQALAKYPDDEKLQKLKELIEQQQQDQQQQDQQNQHQQDQDQQNQDQKNQQNQDQQNQQNQQNQDQQNQEQEPQEAQPSPAQPQQAGEMSEEEAQQLLDAMKLNEKDQRQDLRPYLGQPVRVDKDW
ncbi:MAG: hypothetical protein H8E68_06615 [Kiritimatiellaeota bacterium]|nr:hypothetical protein [Kiritimatiellota bacterium]